MTAPQVEKAISGNQDAVAQLLTTVSLDMNAFDSVQWNAGVAIAENAAGVETLMTTFNEQGPGAFEMLSKAPWNTGVAIAENAEAVSNLAESFGDDQSKVFQLLTQAPFKTGEAIAENAADVQKLMASFGDQQSRAFELITQAGWNKSVAIVSNSEKVAEILATQHDKIGVLVALFDLPIGNLEKAVSGPDSLEDTLVEAAKENARQRRLNFPPSMYVDELESFLKAVEVSLPPEILSYGRQDTLAYLRSLGYTVTENDEPVTIDWTQK